MAQETYTLVGYNLESPLINAAGSINGTDPDRILKDVHTLSKTAIGAITFGSVTVPARAGNEAEFGAPVYYYDAAERKAYNSMGLPNIGRHGVRTLMPEILKRAHEYGKPVIVSGSPTVHPESGDSIKQSVLLYDQLSSAEADLIEINTSCPNVVTEGGGRKPMLGYDLESMEELILELKIANGNRRGLGLKLPPYITDEQRAMVPDLAKMIVDSQTFSFIVTSNTIPGEVPRNKTTGEPILSVPGGAGGMSGPATKEVGRQQLKLWRDALAPYQAQLVSPIEIVSTLGVDSGEEIAVRRSLGASAVGVVTMLWESSNWASTVSNVLGEFAETEAAVPDS